MKIKNAISLDEALGLIKGISYPISEEEISLYDCEERVLSRDVFARESLPPFDRATFDGYAIISKDTIGLDEGNAKRLKIIEEIPAGSVPEKAVKTGECSIILTGAPMPKGADCVVPFEWVERENDEIIISEEIKSGSFITPLGDSINEGQLLASKGDKLSSEALSILASGGISKVFVYRKIKIGLISTGSEVLPIEAPFEIGKIRNSSQFYILSLERFGFEVKYYGICKDETETIKALVSKAFDENDVVITTGGVSVGTYDLTEQVALELGGEILAEKLAFRPGTAFLFSKINDKYLVGLSGNVGSTYTDLWLFCLPFLQKLAGVTDYLPKKARLKMDGKFFNKGKSPRFEKFSIKIIDGEIFARAISKREFVSEKECKFLGFIPPKTELNSGELIDGYFVP